MPHVASCPQCHHDLLVPDEACQESWAKCPECRAFFQLHQAACRELPTVVLMDAASAEIESQSAPTAGEISSPLSHPEPETVVAGESDQETMLAESPPRDELAAAAERVDEWFRSAKPLSETPPSATHDFVGLDTAAIGNTVELGAASHEENATRAASELGTAAESSPSGGPAWDVPQDMERLLANIERPPADAPAAETASLAATVSVQELPKFVDVAGGPRRRKRSLLRTLATSAVAGVVGLALGYYALLWLRGTTGDFLELAQYLPTAMLPAEFETEARGTPPIERRAAEPTGTPAELPAAYTQSHDRNDRYVEPAPFDAPAAAPLTDEIATFRAANVVDAPTFTAEELAAALEAARQAQAELVTDDLADGKEVQQAKGRGYAQLADLAEKVTFADASAGPEPVAQLQQAAAELFRQTLSDAHTRGEVAQIAPRWIASPNRKHGGVFFAAGLTSREERGTVVECRADLEGGHSLTLLLPMALADRLDASSPTMGVAGWIVERPAEQVAGYNGRAPQAIWVGRLIPLE